MIARRYLFGTMGVGWFLPDFIMAFPFELVLPDEAGIASECCKMLRMAKLVRVMAVVRGKSVDRHYLQTISFCSVCCGMLLLGRYHSVHHGLRRHHCDEGQSLRIVAVDVGRADRDVLRGVFYRNDLLSDPRGRPHSVSAAPKTGGSAGVL